MLTVFSRKNFQKKWIVIILILHRNLGPLFPHLKDNHYFLKKLHPLPPILFGTAQHSTSFDLRHIIVVTPRSLTITSNKQPGNIWTSYFRFLANFQFSLGVAGLLTFFLKKWYVISLINFTKSTESINSHTVVR